MLKPRKGDLLLRRFKVTHKEYKRILNYEIFRFTDGKKLTLNGLIGRVLLDDRPTTCNTAYYTKMVDDPKEVKTEVYIVDSSHDIEVLSMIKSI